MWWLPKRVWQRTDTFGLRMVGRSEDQDQLDSDHFGLSDQPIIRWLCIYQTVAETSRLRSMRKDITDRYSIQGLRYGY